MPANALLDRRKPVPDAQARAATLYRQAGRLRQLGRLDEAIAAYDEALKLRPAFPEALRAGAAILREKGHDEPARRFLREAIRLRPAYVNAVLDLGALLLDLCRFAEALDVYRAGLAALPGHGALMVNAGVVLHELGRLPEARDLLAAAVAAEPGNAAAHLNHGNVLARLFAHEEALPAFERALALQPDNVAAHTGRGLALKMLGRLGEAGKALADALARAPDDAGALKNRGELRLLLGDYAGGLTDYEARMRTYRGELPVLAHRIEPWSGEPLAGRRVLTVADDGSGDVIQFARYLPRLVGTGAAVTLICRPRLQRLLRGVTAGARVVAAVDAQERFDLLVPFSSMPHFFAVRPEIPAEATPYLVAEPERVAALAGRLGRHGFKVGLCWRGSQDWRADPNRSLPPEGFAPLAAIPGIRLVSLQVDDAGETAAWLERLGGLDEGADAFLDTAAAMANLDLVVSCDTSVAHLAGALGRPTFLLLRTMPEWRWMLEREDTHWYPTMRLFRQHRPGDWSQALAELGAAVAARAAAAG